MFLKFRMWWDYYQYSKTVNSEMKASSQLLKTLRNLTGEFEKNGDILYPNTFKLMLFSEINMRDINLLSKQIHYHKKKEEKSLYGRVLSMTIIEYFDDINFLLGKHLREEWQNTVFEKFIPEIGQLNKKFAKLKKDNEKQLREIRNYASAHKTKDIQELIFYTLDADYEVLIHLVIEVISYHRKMRNILTNVASQLTKDLRHQIQIVKSTKKEVK